MTPDERTILRLAAEALRHSKITLMSCKAKEALAAALDRIAGAEKPRTATDVEESIKKASERVTVLEDREGDDPRFTPNSGKCWRCGGSPPGGSRVCVRCWHESPVSVRTAGDKETFEREVRAWIEAEEAEERGKP